MNLKMLSLNIFKNLVNSLHIEFFLHRDLHNSFYEPPVDPFFTQQRLLIYRFMLAHQTQGILPVPQTQHFQRHNISIVRKRPAPRLSRMLSLLLERGNLFGRSADGREKRPRHERNYHRHRIIWIMAGCGKATGRNFLESAGILIYFIVLDGCSASAFYYIPVLCGRE